MREGGGGVGGGNAERLHWIKERQIYLKKNKNEYSQVIFSTAP